MNPNEAYILDAMYLPKSKIRLAGISSSLEFFVQAKKNAETIKLWSNYEQHIRVPRHFLPIEKHGLYNFKFNDMSPKQSEFPAIDLESTITLRNKTQEISSELIVDGNSGIINLNTGKGKTIVALHAICSNPKTPTLIVVHNKTVRDQWIEKINKFVKNPDIGIIQGTKFDWKHSITIAMIQTLANRIDEGKITDEFRRWFGKVIYDEVHHLAAPVFSKTADLCLGQRIGLSATPMRADGLDVIVKYNIGPILYSDMSYDLSPQVFFIQTPIKIWKAPYDNLFSMITKLCDSKESYNFRLKWLKKIYEDCNKTIVVGSRIEILKKLASEFDNSCLIIRETNKDESRSESIKKSKIIFAIGSLGLEALDNDNIDSIVFLTPISGDFTITERGNEFLGNQIRQGFGRVLRDNGKEKSPKAFFFDDIETNEFADLNTQVRAFIKREGFDYKELK